MVGKKKDQLCATGPDCLDPKMVRLERRSDVVVDSEYEFSRAVLFFGEPDVVRVPYHRYSSFVYEVTTGVAREPPNAQRFDHRGSTKIMVEILPGMSGRSCIPPMGWNIVMVLMVDVVRITRCEQ